MIVTFWVLAGVAYLLIGLTLVDLMERKFDWPVPSFDQMSGDPIDAFVAAITATVWPVAIAVAIPFGILIGLVRGWAWYWARGRT